MLSLCQDTYDPHDAQLTMTQSTHDLASVHASHIMLIHTLRARSRPDVPYNDDKTDNIDIIFCFLP